MYSWLTYYHLFVDIKSTSTPSTTNGPDNRGTIIGSVVTTIVVFVIVGIGKYYDYY